ncbi:MAG TPA: PfkB family carbohydrate kinase [Planctomycetota bacterium]|nr:PfkB family carbohydrate kinase [Planctomycetota bacterium]HRR82288.1 PfkB family carbohydrate kinase [Planctomycetota bacterium]HRT93183.1 PfkB family carbohydrate kinase [Planctomycetota bacterium]
MGSELISIGLSVMDYLFLCDDLSRGRFVGASDHLVQGGGLAATAAVAMARLGGRVEMWSRVGDDLQGRFILEQFQAEGVDTSQVRVCRGGRSPACAVTVDRRDGERYFTYFAGRGLDPSPEGLDLGRIAHAKAVLVDCCWPEAQIAAARHARACGVPVCADVGGVGHRIPELLRHVDYPIYSQECARRHGGTGSLEGDLRRLAELGGIAPMVTLGADGCAWLEGGEVRRLPAFRVEVVDTTGCGDVFHGAFTFGLARGWDVARTARFASATAALKCRALGGRTGIPTYDEVAAFLQQHG